MKKSRFTRIWALPIGLFVALGFVSHLEAAMSVSLNPSVPSPSPLGTKVTWSASVNGASPGALWYRFRSGPAGAGVRMLRDYGPLNTLDWTNSEREGLYDVEVTARNQDTGEEAAATFRYQMRSRATGSTPVISPTSHPLVFLYSAPPCPAGGRMRVQFESPEGYAQRTPFKPCVAGLSMNFYLAGLRAGFQYSVKHTLETAAGSVDGPVLALSTPSVSFQMPAYTLLQPPLPSGREGLLLQATIFNSNTAVATDLSGNPVWYYPGVLSFLTRPAPGGLFLGIIQAPTVGHIRPRYFVYSILPGQRFSRPTRLE